MINRRANDVVNATFIVCYSMYSRTHCIFTVRLISLNLIFIELFAKLHLTTLLLSSAILFQRQELRKTRVDAQIAGSMPRWKFVSRRKSPILIKLSGPRMPLIMMAQMPVHFMTVNQRTGLECLGNSTRRISAIRQIAVEETTVGTIEVHEEKYFVDISTIVFCLCFDLLNCLKSVWVRIFFEKSRK